jgi:hypothetical protein
MNSKMIGEAIYIDLYKHGQLISKFVGPLKK